MEISITALEGRRGGDEVVLTVKLTNGENIEERMLTVDSRMLFEIGNIAGGELPYALSCEQFDELEYDSRLWKAVKKAFDILSYGDNSKKRLCEKLRQRGFDREISESAAEYVEQLGLVDERRQLKHIVEQLIAKGYGPSRIKQELIKKGISGEIISDELDDIFCEFDFDEILERTVRRKIDISRLDSSIDGRKYREKIISSFFRYGYSPDSVRRILRRIEEEY